MGRLLGAYDSDELDRPDLNKCPDCGCFFAQDNCPLCGKLCPDEMRAGNRRPVKKRKKRDSAGDRVIFVEWYHSWWAITLAMIFMPIVGIALLLTSPHKRSAKITFGAIAIAYAIVSTFGIGTIVGKIAGIFDKPVNTSLSREEYIEKTESVTPEDYFRRASDYDGKYVSMRLCVVRKITDIDAYNAGDRYSSYYVCRDENGGMFEILIRDCIQGGSLNLLAGDIVTVYGEGAGEALIYDLDYTAYSAPCVNVAYISVESFE